MKISQLIAVFCSVLCLSLSAQPGGGKLMNQLDSQGRKQGLWMKYHDNSDSLLRYKGKFVNDVPVDTFFHYYKSGELQSILIYEQEGYVKAKSFHANGEVLATGKYFKQLKDSVWNYYDVRGRMSSSEFYIQGRKYQEWKVYHDNGKLAKSVYWENNVRNGPLKEYHRNGELSREWIYESGSVEGPAKFYHDNGKVRMEGVYLNDAKEGIWKVYDEAGQFVKEIKYHGGVPEEGWQVLPAEDSSQFYRKDALDEFDFYPEEEAAPAPKQKGSKKK